MKKILILLFTLTFLSAQSQVLPDKIVITKNTYTYDMNGDDKLIDSEKYQYKKKGRSYVYGNKRISESKVTRLLATINAPPDTVDLMTKFEIDTSWIKDNPVELLNLYSNAYYDFKWNQQQKDLILPQLTNLNTYQEQLIDYLSNGDSYVIGHTISQEYIIIFFNEGAIINKIKSRRCVWGYQMPWVNQQNDTLYNFDIELLLNKYTDNKKKILAPKKGRELFEYLVNEIIDSNTRTLYELSAYSYLAEIEELKTDFTVVSHEQVYGQGRYIWDERNTMKITLKNEMMLPQVYLQFLASEEENTLYSRDSIKAEYKEIVDRIQSIDFIRDNLEKDSTAVLDIYYFNNSGINEYNINGLNKNPEEWKRHDEHLKWYDSNDKKAIKTSERVYCGCNYRFEKAFLEKAIFFELKSKKHASAIWFLLPDNTLLLYHVQAYHMNTNIQPYQIGVEVDLPFACLLFDKNGNLIER